MRSILCLLLLLSLHGCSSLESPRDRFIKSLDDPRTQLGPPSTMPPLPQPEPWLFYATPHGTYTNLGDGWIADPKGRLSYPY